MVLEVFLHRNLKEKQTVIPIGISQTTFKKYCLYSFYVPTGYPVNMAF